MKITPDPNLDHVRDQILRSLESGVERPIVKTLFHEPTFTAAHIVHDPATKSAAIIDSVLDFDQPSGRTSTGHADEVIEYVEEAGLKVEYILETHAHADHLSAATYLQSKLGGEIAIGSEIRTVQDVFGAIFNEGEDFAHDGSQFDRLLGDGDRLTLGDLEITALHVPGHTPADLAYVIGDAVFVGDTMFMPDYGTARADFPGGDARVLFRSIRRLMQLPGETRVFLCHDYKATGRDKFVWETTIAEQKANNVHAHDGVSEDEFVAMREARDATLGMPRLILPSIQINMRAGHLPEPESNGTRYLKLPLNTL
jgi:glyoxylase-like metal-dependent hydrolase (beta-lactamase superfamily II)